MTVYCLECKVARPAAHIMGAHYVLTACGHEALREGSRRAKHH
jgi:hypothetical protein